MVRIPPDQDTSATLHTNPNWDPRIAVSGVGGKTLTRGRIVMDADAQTPGSKIYALNFLYNPDSIQLSYSVATGDSTPLQPQYRNPDDTLKLPIPLSNSLSFALLFDRTYDVWNAAPNASGTQGVYADVSVLYAITGVTTPVGGQRTDGDIKEIDKVTGPMQMNTCYFYFGGSKSLSFYGMIQGYNITYTHWTIDMIPVRCSISMDVSLLATDPTVQSRLTVPDRNSAAFWNNEAKNYPNWIYSYAGPTL